MTLEIDLFGDFAEQMRTKFNMDAEIDQLEVVRRYAWFDLRRLPQKTWKVHYSMELQQNSFLTNYSDYIDRIRDKAESGEDLTPHASTLINNIQGKDDLLLPM